MLTSTPRSPLLAALALAMFCLSTNALAQFTGPSLAGAVSTVEQARSASFNSDVTVVGNIVAHVREDKYLFRDPTGEIRIEIEGPVWQGRQIGPETRVRLRAEVDRSPVGGRYLWVESLEVLP